jgi:dihydrofolate reductase
MRNLILIAHISLDGFVAGPNGELDGFDASDENLEFVCRITDDADTALFGRNSYQLLNTYWPDVANKPGATKSEIKYSKWYNASAKIVFSKTMRGLESENLIIVSENISDEIRKIKQQSGKNILIFGSPAAFQSVFQHGLVDQFWIFVNPVIFGKGIPLFTGNEERVKLRLEAIKQFSNGEIALNYIAEQKNNMR